MAAAASPATVEAAPPVLRPAPRRYASSLKGVPAPGNRTAALAEFNQGLAAQNRRDRAGSLAAYRRATELDPGFFEAHHNLAVAALAANELPLALVSAEQAAALNPESATARYNFAVALQRSRYPAEAAEQLEQLARVRPADPQAHLALASLYAVELGETHRARVHYQRLLGLSPDHPQAPEIRRWLERHP
ncbi:MAG: tetratricopeptide repeat protein [Verrucomicrobiota bacterium]